MMNKEDFDPTKIGEDIVKVIKTIYDPEIPVDIYELGLIYDVMINEDNNDAYNTKLSCCGITTCRC